jgi:hypothetical protein
VGRWHDIAGNTANLVYPVHRIQSLGILQGKHMTFENPRFDGSDYVRTRDDVRLKGQLLRVWDCMSDGKWRTLGEISRFTGDPESSVSAQLRHLRKERFGSHTVEKEYREFGLFVYRLIINKESL